MDSPKVSVICLSYNHENFIRETLDSVVNQDYPNMEIIIIDDCSTDNTTSIIEEFIKAFPSIQYLRNEKNSGNCKSFNKALKMASGKVVRCGQERTRLYIMYFEELSLRAKISAEKTLHAEALQENLFSQTTMLTVCACFSLGEIKFSLLQILNLLPMEDLILGTFLTCKDESELHHLLVHLNVQVKFFMPALHQGL